jgi:hypothetical protein
VLQINSRDIDIETLKNQVKLSNTEKWVYGFGGLLAGIGTGYIKEKLNK